MPDQELPTEVLVLGAVGTLLIFANGVADLLLGFTVPAPLQFTTNATVAGMVGILLTVFMSIFLFLSWDSTDSREQSTWGTLLAMFAAFSLWLGGGFLVGFILAFAAGILIILLARFSSSVSIDLSPPA